MMAFPFYCNECFSCTSSWSHRDSSQCESSVLLPAAKARDNVLTQVCVCLLTKYLLNYWTIFIQKVIPGCTYTQFKMANAAN